MKQLKLQVLSHFLKEIMNGYDSNKQEDLHDAIATVRR
jgi:hypothetical protein